MICIVIANMALVSARTETMMGWVKFLVNLRVCPSGLTWMLFWWSSLLVIAPPIFTTPATSLMWILISLTPLSELMYLYSLASPSTNFYSRGRSSLRYCTLFLFSISMATKLYPKELDDASAAVNFTMIFPTFSTTLIFWRVDSSISRLKTSFYPIFSCLRTLIGIVLFWRDFSLVHIFTSLRSQRKNSGLVFPKT